LQGTSSELFGDAWNQYAEREKLGLEDIKQLIRHVTLLFPDELAPTVLLQSWYTKVQEADCWDTPSCLLDFISKKDGVPLVDGVWCKKFLLEKDRVIITKGARLYELLWVGAKKTFEKSRLFFECAGELILNVQIDPEKTLLLIGSIEKVRSEDTFRFRFYHWTLKEGTPVKLWGPALLANEESYIQRYLRGLLKVNAVQMKYAVMFQKNPNFDWKKSIMKEEDGSSVLPHWFSPNIFNLCGAAALIVAIFFGVKAYINR
jgi:hypothetical protein